jgi:phosphatidate cytidylyltransferase
VPTLAVATVALPRAETATPAMLKRVASAVVLIPIFVWMVAWAPAWVFAALVVAVGTGAAWELTRLFQRAGRVTFPLLNVAAGAAVTASFLVPGMPGPVFTAAATVFLAAGVWAASPVARTPAAPSVEPVVLGLFGLTWVNWLLGHGALLHALPEGAGLILTLVGVTWAGETAAYGIGSLVGRHKLAPTISPGKTVEGAVAQVTVSVLAAPLLAAWLLPDWTMTRAIGAGALLSVVGQVGDLAESVVKRSVGVKDTGGLIPGHGGLLDRIDSLLFNVPALFYYARLTAGGS